MKHPELIEEWRTLYLSLPAKSDEWKEETEEQEEARGMIEDADFESLCAGWCLAKGLPILEAFAFYQDMIPLGLF